MISLIILNLLIFIDDFYWWFLLIFEFKFDELINKGMSEIFMLIW